MQRPCIVAQSSGNAVYSVPPRQSARVPVARTVLCPSRSVTPSAAARTRRWTSVCCARQREDPQLVEAHDPEVLDERGETDVSLEASTSGRDDVPRSAAPVRAERWQLASAALAGWRGRTTSLLGVAAAVGGFFGSGLDLAGPSSVAQALGVLAAIVAIHEAGHFTAARIQGVHVTKFAIGFGPALLRYQGPEVEYSLRAIPLGGYVGFPDDDPESPYPPDDPDLLRNKGIAGRALVISAGIIANIVFAYSILLAQVTTVGIPTQVFRPGVLVPQVVHQGVAERSGLHDGDLITYIAGSRLPASPASVNNLVDIIKDNPGREVVLRVERNGQAFDLPMVPELAANDNYGQIGVKLLANAELRHRHATGPVEALKLAGREYMKLSNQVTGGLQQLIFNFNGVKNQVSGPVAIVAAGAEVARIDFAGLYQFAAIVSINLAVVNALPLPALDGGYMLLLLIEAVRREKIDKEVEAGIMGAGLLLLTGVGIFMVFRDAIHLSGG